jgi:uncharacterized membrane protein YoaT (DUF817 family)
VHLPKPLPDHPQSSPSAAAIWPPLRRFIAAEYRLGRVMARRRWTSALYEFLRFGAKQAFACLFGGIAVFLMIATWRFYPADAALARYDFLFLCMIAVQIALLAGRLETLEEAKVILIYHLVGSAMELFKTEVGSWSYPEPNFFRIAGVPLFSGFMYSCIGSYICRAWRLFDFEFTAHPRRLALAVLSLAIYVNFFSHHFIIDLRWLLFAWSILLFSRTRVHFKVWREYRANAAAARALSGVGVHLVLGKHRHLHQNLALSVAAAGLGAGIFRQARLLVAAADHELHAGEPDQQAERKARRGRRDGHPPEAQSHAGFPAFAIARNVTVAGGSAIASGGVATPASAGRSSFGPSSKVVPFSLTSALCKSSADSV